MSSDPLVTILVPTIGRTSYLPSTIASIESQTYAKLEILILDNASPPDAAAALNTFAARDSRVRILRSDERLPMFTNFNRGVSAAAGQFICFFFDDDVYRPDFVEKEAAFLEEHPSAGFAGSDYEEIDESGHVMGRRGWVERTEVWDGRRYIDALFRRGRNLIGTPGLMFRRAAMPLPLFPESLSIHFGDFVMLMRIAEQWDVGLIAEPLIQIRRHAGAASSIVGSSAMVLRAEHMNHFLQEYSERHPEDRSRIRRYRRDVQRGVRLGLVWSWLSAATEGEAQRCADALVAHGERSTATLLKAAQHCGVRGSRRQRLLPLFRRVGEGLRL